MTTPTRSEWLQVFCAALSWYIAYPGPLAHHPLDCAASDTKSFWGCDLPDGEMPKTLTGEQVEALKGCIDAAYDNDKIDRKNGAALESILSDFGPKGEQS